MDRTDPTMSAVLPRAVAPGRSAPGGTANILVTVNAAWNAWNFRRAVIAALLAGGHKVTVLAPPDDSVGDLEALGCRFIPLSMDVKGFNPIRELALERRLRAHIRQGRYDVVLSYTIKNNIFGAFAAKSLGVPIIPNISGLGTAFLSGAIVRTIAEGLFRRAFSNLPVVFFENPDDLEMFVERRLVSRSQARELPGTGIDLDHFAPAPYPEGDAPPVFLMISRMLRDKGIFEFVEAARQIKAERPDVQFRLLGPVNAKNRTAVGMDTVEAWVGEGLVEYLGTTVDVRPHIAAASCVVLPSYREGAPRTLIEAAAMARPLIASDVPGCRSVLDAEHSGLFCEARNAESLAAAMRRFLAMPRAERAAMGRAGRIKMEREFDQAIVVDAYLAAVDTATSRR